MYTYKVKQVVKIVDGDTIDVLIDLGFGILKKQRVRVAGIDTPEKRTRDAEEKVLGLDATEWMTVRLNDLKRDGHDLIIKTAKDGKFGRMLGWLYENKKEDELITSLGGVMSINMEMVQEGYAWEYDGGKKVKDLEELREIRRVRGTLSE
jgi:endonuclease YncB( thermonuclease family)